MQDSLNRYTDFNKFAVFKVAKVIAVNRWNNSVDLAFLDGNFAHDVPVISGYAGSNFGFCGLVGPTVDLNTPARTTYYPAGNSAAASTNLGQPLGPQLEGAVPNIPEQGHSLEGNTLTNGNRDIYAVVSFFDGTRVSTGGMFVLGFIFPQVSEMKFPSPNIGQYSLDDFLLVRHPSDFQITIDSNGTASWQHPCGARITIGDQYTWNNPNQSLDTTGAQIVDPTIPGNFLNLQGQDFNGIYQIVNNTARKASIMMEDCCGDYELIDCINNQVISHDKLGDLHTIGPDGHSLTDTHGDSVTLGPNGISVQSKTLPISITTTTGNINISTQQFLTGTGLTVTMTTPDFSANVVITEGNVAVNAANTIILTAPNIILNGNVSSTTQV